MFGPGQPPVPFTVPLLDIEPAAVLPDPVPPPPEAPPDPPPPDCASAGMLVKKTAAIQRSLKEDPISTPKRPSSILFRTEITAGERGRLNWIAWADLGERHSQPVRSPKPEISATIYSKETMAPVARPTNELSCSFYAASKTQRARHRGSPQASQ